MYVCVCIVLYVCMCMYVYVCVCMCMYVYVCVCMCMYVYVCVCMCMYVYVCVCMCMYVCVCVCMYVYVCMCMYVYVCMHACMHACMYVCIWWRWWHRGKVPGRRSVPRKTTVDVRLCHACHAKWRGAPAPNPGPRAPPSTISATPATQNDGRCEIVPRLPRETKVDVRLCHACHAKWRGAPAPNPGPRAPPSTISATPATQNDGRCEFLPRLPRETEVDVRLCHAWHPPPFHVAGVAKTHIYRRFAWQAWHLWYWVAPLGRDLAPGRRVTLRGRRGTTWHPPSFHVAGVAQSHIYRRFAWQAWHLWYWVAPLGRDLAPGRRATLRGRRDTTWHPPPFHVAGVAQTHIYRRFAWQAWHLWYWVAPLGRDLAPGRRATLRGRRGTIWHLPSFCVVHFCGQVPFLYVIIVIRCIHTYIHACMHAYIHIHTHTYIHIHTHTYTHIHTHTYTYIYIHIHTHTYTYIHIHTHTYTYIHIHTHTYTYIHIHTHTYTYIHIHTYIQYNTYTYIHIHTYIQYIHIHTYIPTILHTYIHTILHTYIHTYIPTYLHTYIHSYLPFYLLDLSPFTTSFVFPSFPVPAKTIEAHFRKKLTCGVIRSINLTL